MALSELPAPTGSVLRRAVVQRCAFSVQPCRTHAATCRFHSTERHLGGVRLQRDLIPHRGQPSQQHQHQQHQLPGIRGALQPTAAYASGAPAADDPIPLWRRLVPHSWVLYWPITQRVLITLLMMAIVRMGYFIPMPGVDLAALPSNTAATEGERIVAALYGQSKELPASLFDLGISPHINANIIIAILLILPKELVSFSWLDRLREARKEGKGGEALINDRVSWLAFAFAIYMSCLRAFELAPYALFTSGFIPSTMLALMAGCFMIHHAANTITHLGIGNGSTLVICMGIISEYAETIHQVLCGLEAASLSVLTLGVLAGGYLALVLFTVYLSCSEVRLPIVQYSTTPTQTSGGSKAGGSRGDLFIAARALLDRKAAERGQQGAYFPLALNSSGIMPMIFASAIFYGFMPKIAELLGMHGLAAAIYQLHASGWGLAVYGLLVFLMEFLPFGAVNPPEVSEYFTTINVGIKGVAPGYATTEFLKAKVRQCKFWGGLALAGLAVSAQVFDQLCLNLLGTTLATTSLVIIVGAVIQTARQVESLMEGPSLQRDLDQQRAVIQSLSGV